MAGKKKTPSQRKPVRLAVQVAPKEDLPVVEASTDEDVLEKEYTKEYPVVWEPIEKPKSIQPLVVAPKISKEVPKAHPATNLPTMETTTCLATCVKFVGGWRHLAKGKLITAEKDVIANLRQAGLVK